MQVVIDVIEAILTGAVLLLTLGTFVEVGTLHRLVRTSNNQTKTIDKQRETIDHLVQLLVPPPPPEPADQRPNGWLPEPIPETDDPSVQISQAAGLSTIE